MCAAVRADDPHTAIAYRLHVLMSRRVPADNSSEHAAAIQKGLADLKESYVAQTCADNVAAAVPEARRPRTFDALSPVEQSAASLGVHPDSWKPIGFMNALHYDTLLKSNALDDISPGASRPTAADELLERGGRRVQRRQDGGVCE